MSPRRRGDPPQLWAQDLRTQCSLQQLPNTVDGNSLDPTPPPRSSLAGDGLFEVTVTVKAPTILYVTWPVLQRLGHRSQLLWPRVEMGEAAGF